jgi:hypothetical protein
MSAGCAAHRDGDDRVATAFSFCRPIDDSTRYGPVRYQVNNDPAGTMAELGLVLLAGGICLLDR